MGNAQCCASKSGDVTGETGGSIAPAPDATDKLVPAADDAKAEATPAATAEAQKDGAAAEPAKTDDATLVAPDAAPAEQAEPVASEGVTEAAPAAAAEAPKEEVGTEAAATETTPAVEIDTAAAEAAAAEAKAAVDAMMESMKADTPKAAEDPNKKKKEEEAAAKEKETKAKKEEETKKKEQPVKKKTNAEAKKKAEHKDAEEKKEKGPKVMSAMANSWKGGNPIVFMDMTINGEPLGRLEIELFADTVPRTAENFRALCTGEKGKSAHSGKRLHLKKNMMHRVVPGFILQGGDFTKQNGTGGESIYGPSFPDENFALSHNDKGILSMANAGPNTQNSQFFITLKETPSLDGKHTVFGKVVKGFNYCNKIGKLGDRDAPGGKPKKPVQIVDCGQLS